VSSDFLLGIPEEKKEQEAKKLFTELVEATYAKEVDTEKVIRLIREIRLNHLKSRHFHNFWLSAKGSVYRLPESDRTDPGAYCNEKSAGITDTCVFSL
jgi:hypothetical protein